MGADLIGHNGPRCNGLDIYYKMFFFGVRTSIIVLYWTYGPNQKQSLPLILISLLLLADASVAHLFYFSGSLQNTVQNVKCRWILMTWSKKSKTLSSIRSALGSFFLSAQVPLTHLSLPTAVVCARGHFQVGTNSCWLICACFAVNATSKNSIIMATGSGMGLECGRKRSS